MGESKVDVKQANGFIKLNGNSDLTFGIGGMGRLDIDQARKGNPAKSKTDTTWMKGQKIWAGKFWGFMTLTPFMRTQTMLATSHGGKGPTSGPDNAATFHGRLTTRVKTDLGNFQSHFQNLFLTKTLGLSERTTSLRRYRCSTMTFSMVMVVQTAV
jgi:chitinase